MSQEDGRLRRSGADDDQSLPVRDTKASDQPSAIAAEEEWKEFIEAVRDGELDGEGRTWPKWVRNTVYLTPVVALLIALAELIIELLK